MTIRHDSANLTWVDPRKTGGSPITGIILEVYYCDCILPAMPLDKSKDFIFRITIVIPITFFHIFPFDEVRIADIHAIKLKHVAIQVVTVI